MPDNLKSAVTRSDRNEPVINPDFEAFAEALRMRRESQPVCGIPGTRHWWKTPVKLMYRSVYVDLEVRMVFHDLESLNVAILESLEKFNAQPDPA